MVLCLSLLSLISLRNSYAQACYWNGNKLNTTCFACQPNSGFPPQWQSEYCGTYTPPPVLTRTQTLSCPPNQSGSITQTQQYSQSTGPLGPWVTTSNTCQPNPPTCQTQSQSQTLSCQTGYTGSITQTRISLCPDPYGSPVWQPWVTTTNSCVKSVSNPTNPTSPISPITQTINTPVTATPSVPVTAQTSVQTQTSTTETTATPSTSAQSSQSTGQVTTTPQSTTAQSSSSSPPPKGKVQSAVGLALSLDTMNKPKLTQYNPFPSQGYSQAIPLEILIQNQVLMDMLAIPPLKQKPLKQYLDLSQ